MRVVITGANSAVGQAIAQAAATWSTPIVVVAGVRSERAARELQVVRDHIHETVRIAYDDPRSLQTAFRGASAVMHLAGVLAERPGSSYQHANVDTTRAVVNAATECGVRTIVYVSAIGADPASRNRYWRTKGEAETLVRQSGLGYTILRAPLLLGPGTEATATLKRHLRDGKATMIGGGRNLQQPLDVGDLARAALVASHGIAARDCTLDLVGPVALVEREILERAARLAGRKVSVRSVPKGLVSVMLALREWIGQRGFSRDALDVITADTRLDSAPAATALGIQLTGLDEMLQRSMV
jgi:uncharacterized protein YbjT (DUF2867 family)